jgi:hypothetical protein
MRRSIRLQKQLAKYQREISIAEKTLSDSSLSKCYRESTQQFLRWLKAQVKDIEESLAIEKAYGQMKRHQ